MLRSVEIIARTSETAEIAVFELADVTKAPLPPFTAGAHIDVEPQAGILRQYSLCSLPNERGTYRIGVLRDPASTGGSIAMHGLDIGAQIRISEPRNHFALVADAPMSLLFAGGIGITPLMAMAEELHRSGRDFELHYCARSETRTAFLQALSQAGFADRLHLYFDDKPSDQRLDVARTLARAGSGCHVYTCGPQGFMDWVIAAALAAGVPEARIHREYFKAAPNVIEPGDAFAVMIASTGATIAVPAGRSIAAVLGEIGIAIPTSCEAGVCGTCLTGVREGIPDHRDFYLSDAEKRLNDQMLVCCSRAKTPVLVLDL